MRCVYYSLVLTQKQAVYQKRWIRSVRSLRQYNPKIPVHLFVFNTPPDALLDAAERYQVALTPLGDYRDYLSEAGEALSCIPTLHKLLPLGLIGPDASQILYLDCDTFLFADVESLFHKYRDCDWYAREEPFSRRSVLFPYSPDYLDEDALRDLATALGVRWIPPYNSGVFLVNGSVRTELFALRKDFLSLAWRLAAGASARLDLKVPPELRSRASEWLKVAGNESIAYPAKRFWILDQIALSLTLGGIPNLSHGQFAAEDVLQGRECLLYRSSSTWCTVAHYYKRHESRFLRHAGIVE